MRFIFHLSALKGKHTLIAVQINVKSKGNCQVIIVRYFRVLRWIDQSYEIIAVKTEIYQFQSYNFDLISLSQSSRSGWKVFLVNVILLHITRLFVSMGGGQNLERPIFQNF